MRLVSRKEQMTIIFLFSSALCLFGPSFDAEADEVKEPYPLPAPIIEAFPDEDIAEWVALATHKEDINDTITQADLDHVTTLEMEGEALTGEQIAVFNNEVFPNVTEFTIWGGNIDAFPVLTAFPNVEIMELSQDNITSFPDSNYPKLKSIDLSGNDFSSGYPTFVGMESLININLYDCNISNLPLNAWSNLNHIGEYEGTLNLSGNHIIQVPNQFTFSVEWGYPLKALEETYTYAPITIRQGESYSWYLPIVYQYASQGYGTMGEFVIDGESSAFNVLSPTGYYIPLPTEELNLGSHEITFLIQDRYGSHVSGTYSINIEVVE